MGVSVRKAGVLCSFAVGLYRSYVERGTSLAACTVCKYSQLYVASRGCCHCTPKSCHQIQFSCVSCHSQAMWPTRCAHGHFCALLCNNTSSYQLQLAAPCLCDKKLCWTCSQRLVETVFKAFKPAKPTRFCRFESLEYMRLGGAVPVYSVSKHRPAGSSLLSHAWPPMGQPAMRAAHLSCRCLFVHTVSFGQEPQQIWPSPLQRMSYRCLVQSIRLASECHMANR